MEKLEFKIKDRANREESQQKISTQRKRSKNELHRETQLKMLIFFFF